MSNIKTKIYENLNEYHIAVHKLRKTTDEYIVKPIDISGQKKILENMLDTLGKSINFSTELAIMAANSENNSSEDEKKFINDTLYSNIEITKDIGESIYKGTKVLAHLIANELLKNAAKDVPK